MSFDIRSVATGVAASVSQSLSSRAMSFDGEVQASVDYNTVSIPFEQGDVFRPQGNSEICWAFRSQSLSSRAMSFDSRTAQYEMELTKSQSLSSRAMSFDRFERSRYFNANRLNPFRAGRCLSTRFSPLNKKSYCLNPFRAGRCLSTIEQYRTLHKIRSQSLSSRAMSFDNGREWNYF